MPQGFFGVLLHLGGGEGCGKGACCISYAGPGFTCVLLPSNQNENPNIELKKATGP